MSYSSERGKRPRQDDLPSPSNPIITAHTISPLPLAQSHALLLELSTSHPSAAPVIAAYINRFTQDEAARRANASSVDFDHYSKSIWKALNITHARKSGSKQYEAAHDIAGDIDDAVRDILSRVAQSDRYATRLSAFSTMRKVSKSIITCGEGEIRKVVMNSQAPGSLAEGMERVLDAMEAKGELQGLKDEGMAEKVAELDVEYGRYGIEEYKVLFEKLSG